MRDTNNLDVANLNLAACLSCYCCQRL